MIKSIIKKLKRKWRRFRAKPQPSKFTYEEARSIAIRNNSEKWFEDAIDMELTPDEALYYSLMVKEYKEKV